MELTSVSVVDVESAEWGVVDASFLGYRRVGTGEVTSDKCGVFAGWVGCLDVERHDIVTLDGANYRGKVYVHPVYHNCCKPSCPRCGFKGWAGRESRRMTERLREAERVYHVKVEHIVVSPPKSDFGLSFVELKKKGVEMARARGVVGGAVIPHLEREVKRGVGFGNWYVSPHLHLLAYFASGYKCRDCDKFSIACMSVCGGCDGFEGLTRRLYEKDGYIVAVKGERRTLGGSSWYQLSHASYKVDAKRANVVSWFGSSSYRKLKFVRVKDVHLCPICGGNCQKLEYSGHNEEILAKLRRVYFVGENRDFVTGLCEDGVVVWSVVEGRSYGGGFFGED